MSDNCGCNQTGDTDEYLMVKATGGSANDCGSEESSARKNEEMFDISLGDFSVPAIDSNVNMLVANAAIYKTGMWFEFIDTGARLRVTSIAGNIITLVNNCPNGEDIDGNPSVGTIIPSGSLFTVADSPECLSTSEKKEFVEEALADMTGIPANVMTDAPSDATVIPVGRINSSSSNPVAVGLLRKVFGFFLKAGKPYFNALGSPIDPTSIGPNYRRVAHQTSNGAIHAVKSFGENSSVRSDRQYFIAISEDKERLRGPAYVVRPLNNHTLGQNTSADDPTTWPSDNGTFSFDWDIDSISQVDNTVPGMAIMDHYYVMVRVELAFYRAAATIDEKVYVRLNDEIIGRFSVGNASFGIHYSNVSAIIQIDKPGHNLELKIYTSFNTNYYYRVFLDAIYF